MDSYGRGCGYRCFKEIVEELGRKAEQGPATAHAPTIVVGMGHRVAWDLKKFEILGKVIFLCLFYDIILCRNYPNLYMYRHSIFVEFPSQSRNYLSHLHIRPYLIFTIIYGWL